MNSKSAYNTRIRFPTRTKLYILWTSIHNVTARRSVIRGTVWRKSRQVRLRCAWKASTLRESFSFLSDHERNRTEVQKQQTVAIKLISLHNLHEETGFNSFPTHYCKIKLAMQLREHLTSGPYWLLVDLSTVICCEIIVMRERFILFRAENE